LELTDRAGRKHLAVVLEVGVLLLSAHSHLLGKRCYNLKLIKLIKNYKLGKIKRKSGKKILFFDYGQRKIEIKIKMSILIKAQ